MDFILNSKTKKVEIFYENTAEQQAILEFMSRHLTYREDKTSPNIYVHNPGIGWDTASIATTTNPYTITSNATDLSGTICLDGVYSSMAGGVDATVAATSNVDALCNGAKTYTDAEITVASASKALASAIEALDNPKEKKKYAATKLDNTSDEGGYPCLTAYVPRPSKKIEAVDFGKPGISG